jgi:hypothetical protein
MFQRHEHGGKDTVGQESTLLQRTRNYPIRKEQATYKRNLECDQLRSPFEEAVSSDLRKSSYI